MLSFWELWHTTRGYLATIASKPAFLICVFRLGSWVSMSLNVDEFPIPPDTEFHL